MRTLRSDQDIPGIANADQHIGCYPVSKGAIDCVYETENLIKMPKAAFQHCNYTAAQGAYIT